MANTSEYTYSEDTPKYKVSGYFPSKTAPDFVEFQTIEIQGLMPFGSQTGVLAESDLNPGVVEYLLKKEDGEGNKLYAKFLIKKEKSKK